MQDSGNKADIKKLTSIRGGKKGALTRITEKIENKIACAVHAHELKGLRVSIEKLLNDISACNDKLYDFL